MTSTDLDLFILALVQAGLATTYDLKSKAGLSVGSTAPVLARLEEAGLIGAPKARWCNQLSLRPAPVTP
jgi:hypothetical protein